MSNYRHFGVAGETYFFTQVTYLRHPWLCTDWGRAALRQAIQQVRQKRPFTIQAFVLLPDHLHCIWTLPENDGNYSIRWHLIKRSVSQNCRDHLELPMGRSRDRRRESCFWHRRFWERRIRDETEFAATCEYIRENPVKHGLVDSPERWPHTFITPH